MNESQVIDALKQELLSAEEILNTKYSFDLAEPNYMRCLEIIKSIPKLRPQFIDLMLSLLESEAVSNEPIAYLMHALRWEEMRIKLQKKLTELPDVIVTGVPFRKVLEAYDDAWENQEFYVLFTKNRPL